MREYAICLAPLLVVIIWTVISMRRDKAVRALIQHINQAETSLFCRFSSDAIQITTINGPRVKRRRCVVAVSESHLAMYPVSSGAAPWFELTPGQLRWFGRPDKYHYGTNTMLLHAEIGGQWLVIRLRLWRSDMKALVRALKVMATEDLVTAYRRRRPYIHRGPIPAHPASQDMLGVWTLEDPLTLYLMPLHLVQLDGLTVRRTIPVSAIQQVQALRRVDAPHAPGLVRFETNGESLAFSLDEHENFAAALAEAAKRTLEDPVLWQRKKKKVDADLEDLEDLEEDL